METMLTGLVLLFLSHCLLVDAQADGFTFSLRGQSYLHNDLINMKEIGAGSDGLIATTMYAPCCVNTGNWFLPGQATAVSSELAANFYQTRNENGQLVLNRGDFVPSTAGLFRVNLPDISGDLIDVYIGLYTDTGGEPSVTTLAYNAPTLTCESSGGPVTSVVWRRNCSPLTIGTASQNITDGVAGAYTSTLTLPTPTPGDGAYSCTVENRRGRSSRTITIGAPTFDVTITANETTPIAGRPLTLTCGHNSADTTSPVTIQWLNRQGASVSDDPTLTFDTLRESQREFYCVVTVGTAVGCTEYYSDVQVPVFSVDIADVAGVVGMETMLTCTLSGPSVTIATYDFFKDGTLLPSQDGSSTYTIRMASITDAGTNYTCEVEITLDYLDISSPLTVSSNQPATITLTIPGPSVVISAIPPTPYSGGSATIKCGATSFNTPSVDATIVLLKVDNGGASEVMSTARITAGPVVENFVDVFFVRSYSYSPASRIAHSGSYMCEATITPTEPSSFITDGTSRSDPITIDIVDPILDIDVTMVTGRILDIPPYNTYALTCTASSSVQSTPTAISKTIQWSESFNSGAVTTVTDGVMTSDLTMVTSSSVLSVTASVSGEYVYRCSSQLVLVGVDDSVEVDYSSDITIYGPSLPTTPTSLTILSTDHQSASFQWTVMTVAYDNESYIVTYGVDANNLNNSSAILLGPGDISLTNRVYTVTVGGLLVETSYYYRVVSTNSAGSTPSELATFNTTGVGPSAPVSLDYTMTTPTNLTFSWLPPNDTDVAVHQYQLTCQGTLRTGDTLDNIVMVTAIRSVTVDLVSWANYTCFVVATNNEGSSPKSNEITFITPETVPSGSPGNFVAGLDPTRGIIPFSWTPVPLHQRNGVIIAYSLECTAGPSDIVAMVFPPSSNNRYTAIDYSALTSYTCSVQAMNIKGAGPPATLTITTGEDVPGGPPMSFTAMARTDGMVLFNWTPPPSEEHNGVLTGYTLTCDPPLSITYGANEVGGAGEGFSPATRYMCTLTASTAIGAGPSASVTIVTFASAPIVSVISVSSTQLRVNWTTHTNEIISTHIIYLDGAESGRSQGSEFIITGLQPYTEYSVGVSASNEAGEGLTSEIQSVRTLEDLPGRVECVPRWVTSTSTNVTTHWDPPTQQNGVILAYHIRLVRYGIPDSAPLAEANVTSSARDVTLMASSLVDGVPYTVQILAENSIGVSVEVCQSIDFIAQLEPPAPSSLVISRTADTLSLSWDVPTLIEARGYVSYMVAFAPNEGARRRRQTPDECSVSPCNVPVEKGGVVISGLDAGTTYDLTVTPSNEAGVTGPPAMATAPSVSSSVSVGLIAGAAGGGVAIIIILIILILVCCCIRMRTKKGGFRPESPVPLEELAGDDKNTYTAVNPTPSSSGTTSPRREFTSPLLMSVKEFLESVELEEFGEFVDHMHQNRNKGFERAFQSLPGSKLQSSAVAEKMPKKNRFQNIHPYDDTRVKLQLIPGEPESHYINASFIDGYNKSDLYIAAQGPLPHTVDDFWRMIWEYKLEHVVMLTKCKEAGKTKCQQYWPSDVNKEFITPSNSLSIVCHEHTPYADYEMRKFFMTDLNEPNYQGLVVNHYLFTSWPDHGVPEYATALIGFIRRVRARFNPEKAPLLVHCSAGVGRTGTFIVLGTMLERIKEQSSVNVYQTLQDIRFKRAKMVQTQDQFVFIHDALNDLIRCGDTEIPSSDIRTQVAGLHKIRAGGDHISEFNYQFQLLNQVSPTGQPLNEALQHYNTHKNRYQDKVPNSNSCVYLSHTGVVGGEYINASFINGYKTPKAYIATQAPLETTVEDFWRMVWEFQSRAVVMLCDLVEDKEEKSFQWWPRDVDVPVSVGPLQVTLVSEEEMGDGLVRWTLTVSGEKGGSPGHTRLSISLFHYTDWSENDRPLNTEAVLKMADEVNRVQRSTSNRPITVMCNDGMGRTGAFICIHAQLERLKTEGVMDVFQFAKSARFHRGHLILELEHYIFCHDALADFVETLSEASGYSNF